jgi:hypothetical protein
MPFIAVFMPETSLAEEEGGKEKQKKKGEFTRAILSIFLPSNF